ncbi:argininosuccinate synthase domain-containing protein [Sulfurospirillum arcachonense]|uniref:argininosuccinate synthase domain-containing protein n=1 Tax=Sulfurospirillum arcachonense TaxID=57666 RepID=UPI0004697F78
MRALALFSGGLDSMLAIKLMTLQGIKVTAIHMNIGFGSRTDVSETMKKRAELAGADFKIIDVRDDYIKKVLFNPKYGYGKHFNPCIDCHAFMFRIAKEYLKEFDASFMVTGEILGQRPMSQRAEAMDLVKKLALDEEDLILRPMCAKNMEPTKPEREGWVDREKLLDISGRGRETQLQMAEDFGWEDFQSPGGGCLLTDTNFTKKMREFLKHDSLHVEDIDVLKNGRHLRLPDGAKLVIGRNQAENEFLENAINDKYLRIKADEIPGPFSLLSNNATQEDKNLSARIILTFTKTLPENTYDVFIGDTCVKAQPLPTREDAHKYFVI